MPKATDVSRQWDSELAKLADSLLITQIKSSDSIDSSFSHPVIHQVSPEKQAMLRNALIQRPVARIRAVRPETPNESRLLSNLSSMIQATSIKSPTSTNQKQHQSIQPNPSASSIQARVDLLAPKFAAPAAPVAPVASVTACLEDITPPSTPVNLEQKARAIGGQSLMSSLSLPQMNQKSSKIPTAVTIASTLSKPAGNCFDYIFYDSI